MIFIFATFEKLPSHQNPKSQVPNPKEAPDIKFKKRKTREHLIIGIWNFFGAWGLGFGI
jgi:hypothetical protein